VSKFCVGFLLLFLVAFLFGQQKDLRPDLTISVREDPYSGAEVVSLTMREANYPKAIVQQIIRNLSETTGVPANGVQLYEEAYGEGVTQKFVKSKFGINGIMDSRSGKISLESIAKAVAGIPAPHTIDVLTVIIEDFSVRTNTLQSNVNDSTVVSGTARRNPPSLEYTVNLRVQDPAKITIPLEHTTKKAEVLEPKQPTETGMRTEIILLIIVASVAAGVLVYWMLTGRRSDGSSRRKA
jgi:hypothetical protein